MTKAQAFALEPRLAAARAIWGERMFGNDALKPLVRTCLKERGPVTLELFAEFNAAFLVASE